jgi:pyruvate dehydrogenase E2 component (dihydrolipoyllysine-residue acetyltransferase)
MPRLSDSMEEGTVLRWLKSVGDEVKRGDELVEIETDKANMTYEATDEGVVLELVADEGDTLPIGEVIARIGDSSEASGDGKPPERRKPEAEAAEREEEPAETVTKTEEPRKPAREPSSRPAEVSGDGRVKASPIARRMARDLNVELSRLEGSGPGGRIVKADVEAAAGAPEQKPPAGKPAVGFAEGPPTREPAAAPSPETAKGEVEVVELNRLQQTVARRMAESKATVPHFYLSTEIDMSEAVKVRTQLKQLAGDERPAPTFNDMIVKACALALREFPRANGAYRDGKVELYSRVNVGVAVAAQDALVVPTVFDADRKPLGEIAAETRALAGKVREGTVTPPELSGGTFTVSNLGMFGVTNFAAVINPPQAALLAVGSLEPKAVADRETRRLVVRDTMGVTLACDHRILYGADGAQFLARVRALLEQPLSMAL